jgi:hypothetical protein
MASRPRLARAVAPAHGNGVASSRRPEFSDLWCTRAARLGRRMPSDHALPTSRPRPFATVAYVRGGAAVLEPAVMPPSCVHASPGDPACVLVVHHVRERKAGPQIPVTVAQCRTHRRSFTLYPLGHVPYGRLAVAPVTLDGEVVLSTQCEPTAGDRRSPAWRATQLGAAFAAVDDPTVKLTDRRWWMTQTPERLARAPRCWESIRASRCPTLRRSRSGSRSRGSCSARQPIRTHTPAAGPPGAGCWSVCWTSSARTHACSIASWRPACTPGAGGR